MSQQLLINQINSLIEPYKHDPFFSVIQDLQQCCDWLDDDAFIMIQVKPYIVLWKCNE